jgi:predicted homoserine dehydrogenase-like protein
MLEIRKKSTMVPLNHLVAEVFAVAKHDLKPGDVLDAIGGTAYYSLVDTYENARADRLLPIGLAKGAKVIREIPVDQPITLDDVDLKPSTVLELRKLQDKWFSGEISEEDLEKSVDQLAVD